MTTAAFVWSAVGPFLLLVWCFQRVSGLQGSAGLILALVLGVCALLFPWFGHPLPWWSAGLSANFSVIMALLLAVSIAEKASGRRIFCAREWNTAWIFGAAASLVLYPSALGLGPRNFDTYALGWPWLFPVASGFLFGGGGVVAAALLWRGNRFGWVLLVALASYTIRFQESENLWDYLLDPVYGAVSLLAVLWLVSRRLRQSTT